MMPVHFGIDIDQAALTIACEEKPGSIERIDNTAAAIDTWLEGLPPHSHLAVEASGRCHVCLLERAVKTRASIYLLNPRDVRYYAQGVGRRAKTDRVDAQVIARYLAHERKGLRAYQPPPAVAARIEVLLRRRALLVRTQARLRLGLIEMSQFDAAIEALYTGYAAVIKQIDQAIHELIAQDARQLHLQTVLRSIPGIGPLNSAQLLSLFNRLPDAGPDAFIASMGLDPRANESGKSRSKRKLTKKGPPEPRRLMYLAAQAFARHPLGKRLYERYRQRGLSAIETYVIIARKLLRLAYALYHHDELFDPQRFEKACFGT